MPRTLAIVDYRPEWPREFVRIGAVLRGSLGALARRIDHIGSTAVPDLVAKDVIDVQVSVTELGDELLGPSMERSGFVPIEGLRDRLPEGRGLGPEDVDKRVLSEFPGGRPVNIHVRVVGRHNQRYALLFRDYLRANPEMAAAYGALKMAASRLAGADRDAYYAVKDPVFDLVAHAAEDWARIAAWEPGPSAT